MPEHPARNTLESSIEEPPYSGCGFLRSLAPSIRPLCRSPWLCIARDIGSGDSERRHFGNQIAEGGPIKIGEPADVGHGGVVD